MSDLVAEVGNPKDRFSHDAAHIIRETIPANHSFLKLGRFYLVIGTKDRCSHDEAQK